MLNFARLSIICFCLHFLSTFVAITMYDASRKGDLKSGYTEPSGVTETTGAAVQLFRFPVSVFSNRNVLLEQLPEMPVWMLLLNSAIWGMAITSWYYFYLELRGGSRADLEKSVDSLSPPSNVDLYAQVFWLGLLFFLATYTLHLLEVAELMAHAQDSPVIPIARFFRYPLTPLLFPHSLWQSSDMLVTDRFWLILPNSLIWAFATALIVRAVGKKKTAPRV